MFGTRALRRVRTRRLCCRHLGSRAPAPQPLEALEALETDVFVAGRDEEGRRLDAVLAGKYDELSRSYLSKAFQP